MQLPKPQVWVGFKKSTPLRTTKGKILGSLKHVCETALFLREEQDSASLWFEGWKMMAAQQKPGTGKPGHSTCGSHPKSLCISYQRFQSHSLLQIPSPAGSASTALCSPSPPKAALPDTDEDNKKRQEGRKGSRERSGHGEQSTEKEREEQMCNRTPPTGVSHIHGAHLGALHCSHLARRWASNSDWSRRCFSSFLCCPLTAFTGSWKYQQTFYTKIMFLLPFQLKMPIFNERKTCKFLFLFFKRCQCQYFSAKSVGFFFPENSIST